jgi:hypothetical protein
MAVKGTPPLAYVLDGHNPSAAYHFWGIVQPDSLVISLLFLASAVASVLHSELSLLFHHRAVAS